MGGADRCVCVLPVVSQQDVQSSQRAELQGSLVLAEEGGEDGNGVGKNRPQVDFQRRAGDQRQSCQRQTQRHRKVLEVSFKDRKTIKLHDCKPRDSVHLKAACFIFYSMNQCHKEE